LLLKRQHVNLYFMGRKWLGVPSGKYKKMPHAEEPPASLWWYRRLPDPTGFDDRPTPASRFIIDTYLQQCARGRSLEVGFESKLAQWLQDLHRNHEISPRQKRYWTIPAYAIAHRLHKYTFMKRFRELEKIAIRLFPKQAPASAIRRPIPEETQQAIRMRYRKGENCKDLAKEFGLTPARVGQLCRKENAARRAEREARVAKENESVPMREIVEAEEPF
jgi:hypothetical protein